MKTQPQRKLTRFYIINPVNDRRFEQRFESREDVAIRLDTTGLSHAAIAYDVNHRGMRIETSLKVEAGMDLQVVFPKAPDHIRCFGYVAWARPLEESHEYEAGIAINGWYGVIHGEESWKKFRGFRPKRDRRVRPR